MRGFLIVMVCVIAVCLSLSPVGVQDCQAGWDSPSSMCTLGACGVGERLVAGQPARNLGRLAVAPIRAVIRTQPLRRAGRAVLDAAILRRMAFVASAPVRWLRH